MKTVDLIKCHIDESQPRVPTRGYLGMSSVGHDCGAKLWYDFRFCTFPVFPADTLLKFADGHNSEDITAQRIRDAIPEMDFLTHKEDGEQFGFKDVFGHFRGHCDGVGSGFPEFEDGEWAIWEHKCSDRVVVNKLVRGIEKYGEDQALANWNFMYYVQAVLYMHYGNLKQHLMTVSHSGSRDYVQVITPANPSQAEQWITQAKFIITSAERPNRFREDPEYYQCKWCDHKDICHGDKAPEATCRTCIHLSPVVSGEEGQWYCDKHNFNPTTKEQISACDHHLYIPSLLSNWADFEDADLTGAIEYKNKATGNTFKNGRCAGDYLSSEIKALEDKTLIGNQHINELKEDFDATITEITD